MIIIIATLTSIVILLCVMVLLCLWKRMIDAPVFGYEWYFYTITNISAGVMIVFMCYLLYLIKEV